MEEWLLATHCAPTLAGLKTGSLFTCRISGRAQIAETIADWNRMFSGKGLFAKVLRIFQDRALIYVYRKTRLEADLSGIKVQHFLRGHGYVSGDIEQMLLHLAKRVRDNEEFPHEIGLFLGYPFEDVKGFIENKGKNCKCVGCWKVYTDECRAREIFSAYRYCTEFYCRRIREGVSIQQLIVAA